MYTNMIEVFRRLSYNNTNTNKIIKICSFTLPDILRLSDRIAAVEHRAFSHRGNITSIYIVQNIYTANIQPTHSNTILLPTYPYVHLYTIGDT